jgi:arsenate reductase-like glutaredoxin family protein
MLVKNITFVIVKQKLGKMNIQIIGTKSCSDTRKAERYFKERRIPFHFRDLNEKGLAKGELENIKRKISLEELIDKDGKQYKKRNLQFMVYNIEEELLADPLLLKTPIVRNGNEVTIGYQPEIWKNWK